MPKLTHAAGLVSFASLGSALFFGCSLTGIADVNVGECESDLSCRQVLNPEDGNYVECAAYECVNNGDYNQCQKIEGEIPDGLDNDCDYLIDESDDDSSTPIFEVDTTELASGVPNIVSATFANSQSLSQIYLQQRAGGNSSGTGTAVDPEGGNTTDLTMMAQTIDESTTQNFVIDLTEGCFSATSARAQDCDINEAVAAAGSKLGYFAQVKTQGCADGELRVGAIDPAKPAEFIDRGPGVRNPTYRGVATYGSSCTDNGRKACSDAKAELLALGLEGTNEEKSELRATIAQECGASRPAIAATGKQALTAFLGARFEEEVCSGGPVDIFALGLHERIKQFGEEFVWADPSGDGVPDKIATTISGRPPALFAISGQGFLMAHTHEDGNIRIVFVPLLEDPPGNSGRECPDDDCDSRDGFETDPIETVEELMTISSQGQAEGLRLSWLSINRDEAALAVTWVSGCSDTDDNLSDVDAYARVIRLDISGDEPEVLWEGSTINLGTTRSFPLAVPSDHDFVVPGYTRGDRTAQEEDAGGFFFLTRPVTIQAVRVAAFDGERVVDGEEISVAGLGFRYLTALGESAADEFLMTREGEGTLVKGSFQPREM